MGSRWAKPAATALAILALVAALAALPVRARAQRVPELGVMAIVTAADPALAAGGAYVGLRTSRRTRVSAGATVGASDGVAAWRGELLAHFLLSPDRRRGAGLYGAGGVAAVGGPVDQGYLVLTLGLEGRPGAAAGWFVEAGVGGGARVAAGYRWRRVRGP